MRNFINKNSLDYSQEKQEKQEKQKNKEGTW